MASSDRITVCAAAAAVALACLTVPAAAQSGRFQIEPSGPNILRLDRETGAIASCSPAEAGWTCETLVEADAADAPEAALRAENARLEARIAVLERRLGRIAAIANGADETVLGSGTPEGGIDTERARREIDDAAEVAGYALQRFRGLVDALTSEGN